MRNSSELKRAAREKLTGKWGKSAVTTFVFTLIFFIAIVAASFVIAFIVVAAKLGTDSAGIVANLLGPLLYLPLVWSFVVMFLSLARGNANLGVGPLFDGFKEWGRVTGTLYLQSIYIFSCGRCFLSFPA